ncbi:transposase [Streptomyces sp. NPDC058661]|uniref:transposase n=2 Tax=unclassified Streptomyces TaxID=2593676 RepID=UPI003649F69F
MEWAAVEPVLMALDSGRGPKQLPKRDVLEAILLKARTGMRWEDLPERYGKPASIRQRWNRWSKSGAWAQIMAPLKDAPGDVPPLLPPIEMRGRLDPRALIGHMAAPGDSVPVEPLWGPRGFDMASLDHAMWFHRPFRADEWFLYDQESPIATGGRGLARGRIYDREGRLLVSVVQEGLFRKI